MQIDNKFKTKMEKMKNYHNNLKSKTKHNKQKKEKLDQAASESPKIVGQPNTLNLLVRGQGFKGSKTCPKTLSQVLKHGLEANLVKQ